MTAVSLVSCILRWCHEEGIFIWDTEDGKKKKLEDRFICRKGWDVIRSYEANSKVLFSSKFWSLTCNLYTTYQLIEPAA